MAEPTKPAPPATTAPKEKKPKAMTKSAVFKLLAEQSELSQKQIAEIFEALTALIKSQLGKKGPGVFQIPGLIKITKKEQPATPERMGRNPATGDEMVIKAKPARKVIKVRALKTLKEMAK